MTTTRTGDAQTLVEQGLKAIDAGNYPLAMNKLDEAGRLGLARTPQFDAAYAVCLAAIKQQYDDAIKLCRWAIDLEPCEAGHYLQLGRVFMHADRRREAIHALREGILYRRDPRILNELQRLGARQSPPFCSLPRHHFLNRITGKIIYRLRQPL